MSGKHVCDTASRAMALLPARLQTIFYARLKKFHCVHACHPNALASYGGVAICSGGSYKSLNDWTYLEASRFRANFDSNPEWPLIYEVTGAPACFLANGPYLKTTAIYNGAPVYAQITRLELMGDDKKKGIQDCISALLLDHLQRTVPNFGHQALRAGERLLVRQQNAWCVQSISAFNGFCKKQGAVGFHVLHIPDCVGKNATCFSHMSLDMKNQKMQACHAKLTACNVADGDIIAGSKFQFDIGSRRILRPTVSPGTRHRPRATEHQNWHTDGPVVREASHMWNEQKANITSDAFRMSYISMMSHAELKDCCRVRQLDELGETKVLRERLHSWLEEQRDDPLPVLHDVFESLSALFAFFSETALGVLCSSSETTLRLNIPIGKAVLFRSDFLHHGFKCVDDSDASKLPVHFRAHFYLLSGNLERLPMANFEATLEFLSLLGLDALDDASQLLMLECLQTFVPYRNIHSNSHALKPLHDFVASRGYILFESQQALDAHCGKTSLKRASESAASSAKSSKKD